MASKITFKSNLIMIEKSIDMAIRKGSIIMGREVVAGAKRLSRVDSGQMRDSYKVDIKNNGKKNEFSNTQNYFAFQEQGTKYIKGQKSYEKTINQRKNHIAKIYANQIQTQTRKVK